MKNDIERKSNFEILRIISMVMIFIYHYCIHGGILEVGEYIPNKLIAMLLFIYGRVGVNLFIILSGYFLIDSKFRAKKILKLVLQVLFYSVILSIFSVYKLQISFKEINLKTYFFPIFNGIYWFVTCYIVMYLVSPFLNKMLKSISKKTYKRTIIVGLLILSIIPNFHLRNNFVCSELIWYFYMYLVGAYIKIHKFEFSNNNLAKIIILVYPIITYCLMVFVILIKKHFNISLDEYYFCGLNSILVFIVSIGIFMFFKNVKIENNIIINYIAKISFATYLISDHMLYRKIFWHLDCKTLEAIQKPVTIFILHIILCVIITWLITAIVEFLRINILEKNIFRIKLFDKFFNVIDNWMNI